jgi:hypothetical protein
VRPIVLSLARSTMFKLHDGVFQQPQGPLRPSFRRRRTHQGNQFRLGRAVEDAWSGRVRGMFARQDSLEALFDRLENVEEIAAVEGIDMIAYGHSDLSAQLGVHLDLEHPTFKAAVRRIAAACIAHGKLARGSPETEAQIEEYWQLGCKVLNLPGNDVSTYLDGMKARAGRAHARLKSIGVPTPS